MYEKCVCEREEVCVNGKGVCLCEWEVCVNGKGVCVYACDECCVSV